MDTRQEQTLETHANGEADVNGYLAAALFMGVIGVLILVIYAIAIAA